MATSICPFEINIPEQVLADLRRRLSEFRRPPEPDNAGWEHGINLDFLQELISEWQLGYDWAAEQAELNIFAHYMAKVTPDGKVGINLHFVHETCGNPHAPTILMLAGWPSSFLEFRHVIGNLVRPHDERNAVNVIAVDLPGFGLSDELTNPMCHSDMAEYLYLLMSEGLGLDKFYIHGGDWGAVVGSWLALKAPESIIGLHITMMGLRPKLARGTEFSEAEKTWMIDTKKRLAQDGGYREIQATKPTTLGVGLSDSPAALLAWITEKYHGWTTAGVEARTPPIPCIDILTSATLYWWKNTLPTANWVYSADRKKSSVGLQPDMRIETPTAFAFFDHGFFPEPPKEWTERVYNVVLRQHYPTGGHFPAWVNPDDFTRSLKSFIEYTSSKADAK